MLSQFLDILFGCGHKHYSFPITMKKGRRSPAAAVTGTYVVCLDCGKEFPYDWKQMRIVSPEGERVSVASLATKEAG
jgi:hypothetical protein